MEISNCLINDATEILELYHFARSLQIKKGTVVWPDFGIDFISAEITEERHWKMTAAGVIACNWCVAYSDKDIWEERDKGDAVYIHRIATHPDYRGKRCIDGIVKWAMLHAAAKGKKFIRLDTLGNNQRLIEHYVSAGFSFSGMIKLTHTGMLPLHYQQETNCCLFEIALPD